MTEAPGIGRRCEIKASCFQEAFKAIFETQGSKISHETCNARLLAASQHQPNPYKLYSRLVHKYPRRNRNIQRFRLTKHWNLNNEIRRINQFVTNAIPFISNNNRNRLSTS